MQNKARSLLREMIGDQAEFRPGQWEAIKAVVSKNSVFWLSRELGGKLGLFPDDKVVA